MVFWGILVEPYKPVTVSFHNAPRRMLRVTSATMGDIIDSEVDGCPATLLCQVGNNNAIAVCCLRKVKRDTCNLDLEFEGPDDVLFIASGAHSIHVVGYFTGEQSILELMPMTDNQTKVLIDGPNEQKQSSYKGSGLPYASVVEDCQLEIVLGGSVKGVENGESIPHIPLLGSKLDTLEAQVLDKTTDGIVAHLVKEGGSPSVSSLASKSVSRKLNFADVEETATQNMEDDLEETVTQSKEVNSKNEVPIDETDNERVVGVQFSKVKQGEIEKASVNNEAACHSTEDNDKDSCYKVQKNEEKQTGELSNDGDVRKAQNGDGAPNLRLEENDNDSMKSKCKHTMSGEPFCGLQDNQEGDSSPEPVWKMIVLDTSFEPTNVAQPLLDQMEDEMKEKVTYTDHVEVENDLVASFCANGDSDPTSCGKEDTDATHIALENVQQHGSFEPTNVVQPLLDRMEEKMKEKVAYAEYLKVEKNHVASFCANADSDPASCEKEDTNATHIPLEIIQQHGNVNNNDAQLEEQDLEPKQKKNKSKEKKTCVHLDDAVDDDAQDTNELKIKRKKKLKGKVIYGDQIVEQEGSFVPTNVVLPLFDQMEEKLKEKATYTDHVEVEKNHVSRFCANADSDPTSCEKVDTYATHIPLENVQELRSFEPTNVIQPLLNQMEEKMMEKVTFADHVEIEKNYVGSFWANVDSESTCCEKEDTDATHILLENIQRNGDVNNNDAQLVEQDLEPKKKKNKSKEKKTRVHLDDDSVNDDAQDTNELKIKRKKKLRKKVRSAVHIVEQEGSLEPTNVDRLLLDQMVEIVMEKVASADHVVVEKNHVADFCANADSDPTSCEKEDTGTTHIPLDIVQQHGDVKNNDGQLEEQGLEPKKKKNKAKEKKTGVHLGGYVVNDDARDTNELKIKRKKKLKEKVISANHIVEQEGSFGPTNVVQPLLDQMEENTKEKVTYSDHVEEKSHFASFCENVDLDPISCKKEDTDATHKPLEIVKQNWDVNNNDAQLEEQVLEPKKKKNKSKEKKTRGHMDGDELNDVAQDTNELKIKRKKKLKEKLIYADQIVEQEWSFKATNVVQPLFDQTEEKMKDKVTYADLVEVENNHRASFCVNVDSEPTSCEKEDAVATHIPLEIVQQHGDVNGKDAQLEQRDLEPKKKKNKSKEKKACVHLGIDAVNEDAQDTKELKINRKKKSKEEVISDDQIVEQEGELTPKTKKTKKRAVVETMAVVEKTMQFEESALAANDQYVCVQSTYSVDRPRKKKCYGRETDVMDKDNLHLKRFDVRAEDGLLENRKPQTGKRTRDHKEIKKIDVIDEPTPTLGLGAVNIAGGRNSDGMIVCGLSIPDVGKTCQDKAVVKPNNKNMTNQGA